MAKNTKTFLRYGINWLPATKDLEIELYCIAHGGKWRNDKGIECGEGMLHHYLAARKLLWPKRYQHRWTELLYEQVLKNSITLAQGSASSQKTSHFSEIVLIAYWASPQDTAVLVSTVSMDKLESAVFGEIKMLWQKAKDLHPWLAGHVIDYKHCITTDSLDDAEVRDLRKGIIGKSCYRGERYVGLGVFAGIKQEHFWFLADELQYMPSVFLDCLPNMRSNTGAGGLKVLGSFNPNHDPESQAGIAAEPLDGWESVEDNEKTSVWPIQLSGGVCVNLIGTDSPNFDEEEDRYPKLIGHDFERIIRHDYGKNSPQYETQVMGRMKLGLAHSRVITRQLCRDHRAHEKAIWQGTDRIKIYSCDPAYGGGDRCIAGWGEFGTSDKGKVIIRIEPPKLIKINLKLPGSPEDQIADFVHADMRELEIPAKQGFYDSFGKGTVGFAFARKFGHNCPVPINAGEQPTKRPVRADLFVTDERTGEKRLKRCDEHYSKFITEMWFSVRYAIEAEQVRELPIDVMSEGCWREYDDVAGGKIEVEPKDKMKERMGKSPDLFDWVAILFEGARRHGFVIDRLGAEHDADEDDDWFMQEAEEYSNVIQSKLLEHA